MIEQRYSPIGPARARLPGPRRLLRVIALAVLGMGVVLFVRTAMKPPDPRKATSLTILGTFVAANGAPLLLSLRLPPGAVLVRALAAVGVLADALLLLAMSLYAVLVVRGEWSRPTILGVVSSISAAIVCGAALLFRAGPVTDELIVEGGQGEDAA